MNIEGRFEAGALRILREIPGLTVVSKHRAEQTAEATIRFAGARAKVAVQIKQRVNIATAWQLVHESGRRPHTPLLVIANETTSGARDVLKEHGIAVIDRIGNAHIELPGLLFHLEGRRGPQRAPIQTAPTRLRGKAGVAAQALLLNHDRAWHVQDLAEEAGVSAGLAHRIVARLEKEGTLAAEGIGPNRVRRVVNPTALLDLWVEENTERPTVTRAHMLAQTPQHLVRELGLRLGRGNIAYAMTGAAGASVIAPFVTAIPVVDVWAAADAAPEDLCELAKASRVTDGHNVAFLQAKDDTPLAFRQETKGLWLANTFRLYADLRRDPRRGREQADHLRREIIGF